MKVIPILMSALLSACVMYKGKPNHVLDVSSLDVLSGTYIDQGSFGYRLSGLLIPKDEQMNFWPEKIRINVIDNNTIEVTAYSEKDEEYSTNIVKGKDFDIEESMLLVGSYNTTNTHKGGSGTGVLPLPPMASTAKVKKYIALNDDRNIIYLSKTSGVAMIAVVPTVVNSMRQQSVFRRVKIHNARNRSKKQDAR
jgi:hypothetical protein